MEVSSAACLLNRPFGADCPFAGMGFAAFSAVIDTYIRWDTPDEDVSVFVALLAFRGR